MGTDREPPINDVIQIWNNYPTPEAKILLRVLCLAKHKKRASKEQREMTQSEMPLDKEMCEGTK